MINEINMPTNFEISYKQELIRKCIHLCSLSIPIAYSYLDKEMTLTILIPLTVLCVSIDLAIKIIKPLREYVLKIFGSIMRPHEVKNEIVLNGASWVLISACLCVLVLPKIATVTGFTVLIISDTAAALLGKKYGRHKWFDNKSIEGTLAFIVFGLISVYTIGLMINAGWQYYALITIATIISGLVEAVSGVLKIDDNFSIPLSIGAIVYVGDYLLADVWHYTLTALMK